MLTVEQIKDDELRRLRAALAEIAKQKLRAEMDEEPIEGINADWEHGYECCVRRAREALQSTQECRAWPTE